MIRLFSMLFTIVMFSLFSSNCPVNCHKDDENTLDKKIDGQLYKSIKNATELNPPGSTLPASHKYFYFSSAYLFYLAPSTVNVALDTQVITTSSVFVAPTRHPNSGKNILSNFSSALKINSLTKLTHAPKLLQITTDIYPSSAFVITYLTSDEIEISIYGRDDGTNYLTDEVTDTIHIKQKGTSLFYSEKFYNPTTKKMEDSFWNNVELKPIETYDNNTP